MPPRPNQRGNLKSLNPLLLFFFIHRHRRSREATTVSLKVTMLLRLRWFATESETALIHDGGGGRQPRGPRSWSFKDTIPSSSSVVHDGVDSPFTTA
ncbi:hypothetical protein TanjilG_03556 [Lupinus angustifolius]|uniref:Uncharacterized protein n=1 Tax=Lupinus angustifolius TaxID=3871 RepID=A0A1J7IKD0_LUPAN|nr:hypothetical protein TanjilG_03556 [Lupinus angustifolius]